MPDLYLTERRRALLCDVSAGNVLDGITDSTDGHTWLVVEPDPPRKVCARIRELELAGWVEQVEAFWRLTDLGRDVLAAPAGPPGGYGPQQLETRLGLAGYQIDRAIRAGLIPAGDTARGWSAAVVEAIAPKVAEIRAQVGALPDVGAVRAAEVLAERFGIEVPPAVLLELARLDVIPVVGDYKGHPLYCGRTLELFTDRAALDAAMELGRLHTADEAAAYLRVRRSDLDHLIRSGWLHPTTYVHSSWQRRRDDPQVPLYRTGDLDVLAEHPAIDWDAVRATPAGRRSPLARLSAVSGRRP